MKISLMRDEIPAKQIRDICEQSIGPMVPHKTISIRHGRCEARVFMGAVLISPEWLLELLDALDA